jgi:hypothetical protein
MNFKPKPIMFIIFCDFDGKLKTCSRASASGRILTTKNASVPETHLFPRKQKIERNEGRKKKTHTNVYPLEERKGLVPLIPSGYLTLGSLVVKRYFEVYDGKRSQLGFSFSHEKKTSLFSISWNTGKCHQGSSNCHGIYF